MDVKNGLLIILFPYMHNNMYHNAFIYFGSKDVAMNGMSDKIQGSKGTWGSLRLLLNH